MYACAREVTLYACAREVNVCVWYACAREVSVCVCVSCVFVAQPEVAQPVYLLSLRSHSLRPPARANVDSLWPASRDDKPKKCMH